MPIKSLTAVAVRITGIAIGLTAVGQGIQYFDAYIKDTQSSWIALMSAPFVLLIAAAVMMVVFPMIIAGRLLPKDYEQAEETDNSPLSYEDIELFASSLAGLYFFVQAFFDFVYIASMRFAASTLSGGTGEFQILLPWTADHVAILVTAIVELLAGLWLLFGARGLWRIVRWAKS